MDRRLYSRGETNRIYSDVPNKTLAHWINLGLVQWENERVDGRGLHREFSLLNLCQLGVVRELTGFNIPLHLIKTIMEIFFFEGSNIDLQKAAIISWTKDFPKGLPSYLLENDFLKKPVMEKSLLLYKSTPSIKRWEAGPGGFLLCDYSRIDFLIEHKPVVFTIIHLPTIATYVQTRIKEEGLG